MFTLGNKLIKIYHATDVNADTIILNPKYFGKNSFTLNDMKQSGVKRTFFYMDLSQKENFFLGKPLYEGVVNGTDILDIMALISYYQQNKDDMKNIYPIEYKIMKNSYVNGIFQIGKFLANVKKYYKGIFYDNGIKIINLFIPITVKQITYNNI